MRGRPSEEADLVRASYVSTWRRAHARLILAEASLAEIGDVLGRRGLPWLPIKGADLVTRGVFEYAEERPFSDIDVVVPRLAFADVRDALELVGWRPLYNGPLAEDYLTKEGYAWPATRNGELLEVHHRLWGSLPTQAADRLLEASKPAPDLGNSALRCPLSWAWLLAAVHCWMSPHRDLIVWRDLPMVIQQAGDDLIGKVSALTAEFGLALPAVAASSVAARLFNDPRHRCLVAQILPSLRWSERRLEPSIGRTDLTYRSITLARLLAGRPSRNGVRSLFRAVWPHPAVVERRTPSSWPWAHRRLSCLLGLR